MFTKTSDLFQYIGLSLFGLALVLALIHFLGEVHGLIITAIILFNQSALLNLRISMLQRDLANQRQGQDGADGKVAEKA